MFKIRPYRGAKAWFGFCVAVAGILMLGCQADKQIEAQGAPVFYPPAPDPPRLQFLKTFSGPADVGRRGGMSLETFLLGEEETTDMIGKPYGVAVHDHKIYVCDVQRRALEVLDLKAGTFRTLPKDPRLTNPVNICVDDEGNKYVTDGEARAVFVYDRDDRPARVLGAGLDIAPMGVAVHGNNCYVTDLLKNEIIVFDKNTEALVRTMGRPDPEGAGADGFQPGTFNLISDVTIDTAGNVYATDRALGYIAKFSPTGAFLQQISFRSAGIHGLMRPKGIQVDRAGRIWVVDAAPQVAKIYDASGRLLLYFGQPGPEYLPGMLSLPAQIVIDYDTVDWFEQYAVPGADLDFVVLVTSQFGPAKVTAYGFGRFPGWDYGPAETAGAAAPGAATNGPPDQGGAALGK